MWKKFVILVSTTDTPWANGLQAPQQQLASKWDNERYTPRILKPTQDSDNDSLTELFSFMEYTTNISGYAYNDMGNNIHSCITYTPRHEMQHLNTPS